MQPNYNKTQHINSNNEISLHTHPVELNHVHPRPDGYKNKIDSKTDAK